MLKVILQLDWNWKSPVLNIQVHGKVYSIQHYVIKFVSDLQHCRLVVFSWYFRFPPSIKLIATI